MPGVRAVPFSSETPNAFRRPERTSGMVAATVSIM